MVKVVILTGAASQTHNFETKSKALDFIRSQPRGTKIMKFHVGTGLQYNIVLPSK